MIENVASTFVIASFVLFVLFMIFILLRALWYSFRPPVIEDKSTEVEVTVGPWIDDNGDGGVPNKLSYSRPMPPDKTMLCMAHIDEFSQNQFGHSARYRSFSAILQPEHFDHPIEPGMRVLTIQCPFCHRDIEMQMWIHRAYTVKLGDDRADPLEVIARHLVVQRPSLAGLIMVVGILADLLLVGTAALLFGLGSETACALGFLLYLPGGVAGYYSLRPSLRRAELRQLMTAKGTLVVEESVCKSVEHLMDSGPHTVISALKIVGDEPTRHGSHRIVQYAPRHEQHEGLIIPGTTRVTRTSNQSLHTDYSESEFKGQVLDGEYHMGHI